MEKRFFTDYFSIVIRLFFRFAFRIILFWWRLRRPATTGALVAIWHEKKLLVLRTCYRNCLSLPGGGVKRNETARQAAKRELMEELQIDLLEEKLIPAWKGTINFEYQKNTVEIYEVFTDNLPAFKVSGREIIWADWKTTEEIRLHRLLPHLAEYLEKKNEN